MQTQNLLEHVRHRLSGIAEAYSRLMILVGPPRIGKTKLLRALSLAENVPVLNLSQEISRSLLDLTERQRILQLPTLLENAVAPLPRDLTLLDNIEVLFNPVLRQDPLRLLFGASRQRTIVTSWLGSVENGYLSYAAPEHPEFRRYPSADLLFISLGAGDQPRQVKK